MTRPWLLVALVGLTTILIKASGQLMIAGRSLPPSVRPAIGRLAPVLFGALVATQTFSHGGTLGLDARAGGLAAAVAGAYLRLPSLLVIGGAVAVTATIRHLN
jgi:branched-subunit amino acid transport protein